MLIHWEEKLSVGVEEIDNQHKLLLEQINELRLALADGKGKAETAGIVGFLEDYVWFHFEEEERLMQQYQYPLYQEHKQAHQCFIKEVDELKQKLSTLERKRLDTSHLAADLESRMSGWFVAHICSKDRKLADFLFKQTNGHVVLTPR